jgi:hypothetical protein
MLGDKDDIKDVDTKDEFDDTMEQEAEEIAAKSGNVGDPSVELNVDEIVAELEADMGIEASDHGQDARKRLESLLEERRAARELDELDEFALDDA